MLAEDWAATATFELGESAAAGAAERASLPPEDPTPSAALPEASAPRELAEEPELASRLAVSLPADAALEERSRLPVNRVPSLNDLENSVLEPLIEADPGSAEKARGA